MRLSEWRAKARAKDAVSAKVTAVVDPVLVALGAGPDPHGWIAWGEEPANRFTVFVPTEPGLISCFVRVNVPGEGPRATTKLVRWNRVAIGELAVETQAGHRMLSFQLESQVLRGVDAEADRVAAFALRVIAAIDGRPLPAIEERGRGRKTAGRTAPAARAAKGSESSAKGSESSAKVPAVSPKPPIGARKGSAAPSKSPAGPAKGAARPSQGAVAAARPMTIGTRPRPAGAAAARAKAPSNAGR